MISFKLKLSDVIKGESSRNTAIQIREYIITLLDKYDVIEIDLSGTNLTPSVADEVIGVLAYKLNAELFKKKIKILNSSESQMALMKHVIARRLKKIHE
ncbi:MAG: STAS-like domain-containing protein [Gammaproteobacteria bacterium]